MNGGNVRINRRHRRVFGPGEGALDDFGAAEFEGICSHDVSGRIKGNACCGCLETDRQRVICPFADVDLTAFHVFPGIGRQTARFQTDDVRDIQLVEHFPRTENLEIVG